jgi:hypothetical protein
VLWKAKTLLKKQKQKKLPKNNTTEIYTAQAAKDL